MSDETKIINITHYISELICTQYWQQLAITCHFDNNFDCSMLELNQMFMSSNFTLEPNIVLF